MNPVYLGQLFKKRMAYTLMISCCGARERSEAILAPDGSAHL